MQHQLTPQHMLRLLPLLDMRSLMQRDSRWQCAAFEHPQLLLLAM
jgi:hypothetical protein